MKQMMHRLLALLLALSMLLSLPVAAADSAGTEPDSLTFRGAGTEADPYRIATAQELAAFRDYINSAAGAANPAYWRQEADIDLSSVENWTPIGAAGTDSDTGSSISWYFTGVYDGNGYTVSGLRLRGASNLGLFGSLRGATVQNLTVRGSITQTGRQGYGYTGGIAACTTDAPCVITGCTSYVDITGVGAGIGGIVGQTRTDTKITACANYGTLTTEPTGTQYIYGVGGIVGYCAGDDEITACFNAGPISCGAAGCNLGGIVGAALPQANVAVRSCYNTAAITSAASSGSCGAGGIVGKRTTWYDDTDEDLTNSSPFDFVISDCYNAGTVSSAGTGGAGAIVGYQLFYNSYGDPIVTAANSSGLYALPGSAPYLLCGVLTASDYSTAYREAASVLDGSAAAFVPAAQLAGSLSDSFVSGENLPELRWQRSDTLQTVRFRVTDAESGAELNNCLITVERDGQEVDFESGLPMGRYDYTIHKSTFADAAGSFYVGPADCVVAVALQPARYALALQVSPAQARVSLRSESGAVELPEPEYQDGAAIYRLTLGGSATYGAYTVSASAYGYDAAEQSFRLTEDTQLPLTLTAARLLRVNVRAVDADGQPVTIRQTVLTNTDWDETADETDGSYSVPAGSYRLVVRADGYGNAVQTLTLTEDQTVTVTMPSAVWDGETCDTLWYDEQAQTYDIYTAAELAGLAALCAEGASFSGKTVRLQADLDLGGHPWTPIGAGSTDRAFRGAFDGQGHTIRGLALRQENFQGLFGYLNGARLQRFTLVTAEAGCVSGGFSGLAAASVTGGSFYDISLQGALQASGNTVGGLAGYVSGARFDSCYSYAAVTGTYDVGGLAGTLRTKASAFTGCAAFGSVTATAQTTGSAPAGVGGLVGSAAACGATVRRCLSTATVTGGCAAGGLVGTADAQSIEISDSYAAGAVTGSSTQGVGGLLGFGSGAQLARVYSVATLTAPAGSEPGALVGGAAASVEDGFYLRGTAQSACAGVSGSGEAFDAADAAKLAARLGAAFAPDDGRNNGYPILKWQSSAGQYQLRFALSYDTEKNLGQAPVITLDGAPCDGTATVSGGLHTYTVAQPGYETISDTVAVQGADELVELELQAQTYAYTITADPQDAQITVTDADGAPADPAALYNGVYSYQVSRFGYTTRTGTFTVAFSGGTLAVTLEQLPTYPVTLRLSTADGQQADYTITFCDEAGETVGTWSSMQERQLPAGTYTYTVRAGGYEPVEGTLQLDAAVTRWITLQPKETAWDGVTADTGWYAAGQREFSLYTGAELAGLASLVNGGKSFSGCTVRLCRDISLGEHDWTVIGQLPGRAFSGVFDGGGHTVTLGGRLVSQGQYFGLFGYLSGATVQNLVAAGQASAVYQTGTYCYDISLGAIAGYAVNSSFHSCGSRAALSLQGTTGTLGMLALGGIAGYSVRSSFYACHNTGKLTGALQVGSGSGTAYLGGITGYFTASSARTASLDSCYNTGTLQAEAKTPRTGGLIGGVSGVTSTSGAAYLNLSNCYVAVSGQLTDALFTTVSGNSTACTNLWYLEGLQTAAANGAASVSAEQLCSADFAARLGDGFQPSAGAGYPLNAWQTQVARIELAQPPARTTYDDRESFDDTGVQLRVYYSGSDTPQLVDSGWTVADGACLLPEQSSVTLYYLGASVQIPITVRQVEHEIPAEALNLTLAAPRAGQTPQQTLTLTPAQQEVLSSAAARWYCGSEAVDGPFEAGRYYRAELTLQARHTDGVAWYRFAQDAAAAVDGCYEIAGSTRSDDGRTLRLTVTWRLSDCVTDRAGHLYYEGLRPDCAEALDWTLAVQLDGKTQQVSLRRIETLALELGRESDGRTGIGLYTLLQALGLPQGSADSSKVSLGGRSLTLGQLRSHPDWMLFYGEDGQPLPKAQPLKAWVDGAALSLNALTVTVEPGETFEVRFVFRDTPVPGAQIRITDSYGNLAAQADAPGTVRLNAGELYDYTVTIPGCQQETGRLNEASTVTLRALAGWNGTYTEPARNAQGAYLIGTPEELAWFNREATSRSLSRAQELAGADVVLIDDINLAGYDWIPIAGTERASTVSSGYYSGGAYTGRFDGQGHTIYGLRLERTNVYSDGYGARIDAVGGLFGYVRGAVLCDLGLEGSVTVYDAPDGTESAGSWLQVGGLVGFAQSGSVISGCYTDMDVRMELRTYRRSDGTPAAYGNPEASDTYVGGIAGSISLGTTIRDCYSAGTLYGEGTRTVNLGGIAGASRMGTGAGQNVITRCYSACTLSARPDSYRVSGATSYFGGITGVVNAANYGEIPEISYCFALNPSIDGGRGANTEAGRIVGNGLQFDLGGKYNYALQTMELVNTGCTYYDDEDSGYRSSWGRDLTAAQAMGATAFTNVYWNQEATVWNFALPGSYPVFVWQNYPQNGHTHVHSYTAALTQAPTCTLDGLRTFTCGCGDSYTEPVPALGHSYVPAGRQEPTEDAPGYERETCSRCGDTVTRPLAQLTCPAAQFGDVDRGRWYHTSIDFVLENGLFNGMSQSSFAPDRTMTRAMLVTVLHRLAGSPSASGAPQFADVAAGKWYSNAIAWAAEQGVVNGVGQNRFDPEGEITRQQLVTIFYRYAALTGRDVSARADLQAYTDAASVSAYARTPMAWAVAAGLVNGLPGGRLDPAGSATRAQVAAIVMRFCQAAA